MGGDNDLPSPPSTEEESLLSQHIHHQSLNSSVPSENEEGLSQNAGPGIDEIIIKKQKLKVYADVLMSYQDLQPRIDRLEESKDKILSYNPGSWTEKSGGMDLKDYLVPNITSLLLIGPKASGKSTLVNKISRVLENDVFLPGRAQVSHNSSTGDGTYFLHEYIIPRHSGSFCLYDTRSLSVEDQQMLDRWMKKGLRHGELIERKSDGVDLKANLMYRARRKCASSQFRAVGFVIFVVDALSVLESMDSVDEDKKQYSQVIAANFKNPLLSFRDDKPAVVVTHGDLLSLSDRIKIRVYLGELLGVPPATQIFDIPDNNDPATTLAIVDLLSYCLGRADRNLPGKKPPSKEVSGPHVVLSILFMILAMVLMICAMAWVDRALGPGPLSIRIEWPKIRHLWSG